VQVSSYQGQRASQSQYLAGRDCAQQSQSQLGKTSCLPGEMEQLSKPMTEAIFYKQNHDQV